MPSEFAFSHVIDVRFRDCDAMGHVNHAVYLTYLEQCRFAFWRHLTHGARRINIIIARAECDYRAPAYPGDRLEVHVRVAEIGRSSFVLAYEIVNGKTGQRLAQAKTVQVSYDYAAQKPTPLDADTRALLEATRHPRPAQ